MLVLYLSAQSKESTDITGQAFTSSLSSMITCPTGLNIEGDHIVVRISSAQGEGCAEVNGAMFYQLKQAVAIYEGLENVPIRAVNTQTNYQGFVDNACRCDSQAREFVVTGIA